MRGWGSILAVVGVIILAIFFCGLVLVPGLPFFGYVLHVVNTNEVGVRIVNGQFDSVVGPGSYNDLTPFADIVNVRIEGVSFTASDSEVLVENAAQTIGVTVQGDVLRPRDESILREKWALYRGIYLDDQQMTSRVEAQARQAMKECVGERSFEEAAVGAARDDLRLCIDTALDRLLQEYGLTISNLVVPNIEISDRTREQINNITDAQNQALVANAQATRVFSEAQRDIAQQQAVIQITQGAVQEQIRQQATGSALELTQIAGERAVVEAQLELEEFRAQQQLEIQLIQLEIDRLVAQSETVTEAQVAAIIQANPRYAQFLRDQLTAEALKQARLVYLASGTNPLQIIGDDDVMLSLDITPAPVPVATATPSN